MRLTPKGLAQNKIMKLLKNKILECPRCGQEMQVKSVQIPSSNIDWEAEAYVECPSCGYCDLIPL